MKRLKKIILIVMILFLIIININCSYATQENGIRLKVEPEEKQYKQGDIVSLEVKVDSLPEIQEGTYKQINTLAFDFVYDKEILEINKIYDEDDQEEYDDIDAVRGWEYTLDSETNCILLINYDMYSTLDQTILKINLKVKKDFKTLDIKLKNIEASGGVGEENNFKSENDLIINVQGILSDGLYLSTEKYKIGENDEDTSNYQEGDKYITKISPNTTLADFKLNCKTNGNITVYKQDGEELGDDEYIGTGMTLIDELNGETITITLIVMGDVNGNGKIDTSDLTSLRGALYEGNELDDIALKALDIEYRNIINTKVLTILRNVLYEGGII